MHLSESGRGWDERDLDALRVTEVGGCWVPQERGREESEDGGGGRNWLSGQENQGYSWVPGKERGRGWRRGEPKGKVRRPWQEDVRDEPQLCLWDVSGRGVMGGGAGPQWEGHGACLLS